MLLKVSVTRSHIYSGVSKCKDCPIALALNEILPGQEIRVGPTGYLRINDRSELIALPIQAQLFVFDYDRYGKRVVKPFVFELEIPDDYITTLVR
jgi:hypothetical protein